MTEAVNYNCYFFIVTYILIITVFTTLNKAEPKRLMQAVVQRTGILKVHSIK